MRPMHYLVARLLTFMRTAMRPATPLVEVGISRTALLHNFRTYQAAYPGIRLAPVLKSNAYGHDLGLVARLLDREPIAFFMVDSFYEARRLRSAGIRSRIVVMGYTRPEDIAASLLPHVDFAITDSEQLRTLATLATRTVHLHLKLDTGMHRQGIQESDLAEMLTILKTHRRLSLMGICSHFADADTDGSRHAQEQLKTWLRMKTVIEQTFPQLPYRHFAATKGIRFAKEADTTVARLGIGLYGFDTSPGHGTTLKPVLELRSIIGELRTVPAGESVGYNATWTARESSRVATIPAGYFEGIDRRLSNTGKVLVKNVWCPIIGRVSMNMLSVDVTQVPDVQIGDSVVLISRDESHPNSVPAIAAQVSTSEYKESEYVILTHIPPHLRRRVD